MMFLFELSSTLVWAISLTLVALVVLPYAFRFHRQRRRDRVRLDEARVLGIDRPVAQYPFIDPQHCIGCGSCVRACPEGDVLGVVGGVAVVINGLRCVGHGRCADACPVGAIEVGLGDLAARRDVPLLTGEQETTLPGVFVAGELSGMALIRNAIEQGETVIETIARRTARAPRPTADDDTPDVLIVGAGPAGISAALAARERGLSSIVFDQSREFGGTILHFPRRKMVLTRPVELPGGAALSREEYSKEELLELFREQIHERRLAVRFGEKLDSIERLDDKLVVHTSSGSHPARHVILALGRRGTPRKLGAPGEERSKVMYQLRDAASYRGQRILVVGGGDSAVEAAVGLARQPRNEVTISYRKNALYRIKRKNKAALESLAKRGKIRLLFESRVESIDEGQVRLQVSGRAETIENDYVFVFIGGDPPFELLRRCGVRFGGEAPAEPEAPHRPRAATVAGLAAALMLTLGGGLHAQKSPHGDLAIACTQCHTSNDWSVARKIPFDHRTTGFPLAGRHAVAACRECHQDMVFSRVATACQDCHRDAHLGELGLACATCHDTRRWDVRADYYHEHSKTLFPLLGAHARVDCEACHGGQAPNQFRLTPTDCVVCHRQDFLAAKTPAHPAQPTDCRQCHGAFPATWRTASFHHPDRFPLTGAHAALACEECHRGPAGTTSPECLACHQADYNGTRDPNHRQAGLPTACANCHTTASWTTDVFDHATTGFPLDGAHRTVSCGECHKNGYAGTARDCYSCHQADYNATTDPNHRSAGLPTACQQCHTTASWGSGNFDHASTGFPLTGAHASAACASCHQSGYAGTPTECVACHRSDYDKTTDPNHASAGFPTTCQTCHSTASWGSATFNHSNTGFPLTGAHASAACASCHQSGYAGTPTECVACHRSDYDKTTDPNHASAGFPTTCQTCHSTATWGSANFNHSNTGFPLIGAHVNVACTTCHKNGYAGTPSDCYSCHSDKYNQTTDPNHASAGFPKTCQTCHSQSSWSGATFNHSMTGFPLVGAHTRVACSSCHQNGYAGTPTDCYSCHRSNYESTRDPNHVANNYSHNCLNCHNQNSWGDAGGD